MKFIINTDDKKEYKKILLEYPYLYFNNFHFNKSIPKENDEDLKTLYIIDYDYIKQNENLYNKIKKVIKENDTIQFIFLTTEFNVDDTINWKQTILFHDIDNLKSVQKLFYKRVIQNASITTPEINDWDTYKQVLDDNDVKCVVVTNNQLKFN